MHRQSQIILLMLIIPSLVCRKLNPSLLSGLVNKSTNCFLEATN